VVYAEGQAFPVDFTSTDTAATFALDLSPDPDRPDGHVPGENPPRRCAPTAAAQSKYCWFSDYADMAEMEAGIQRTMTDERFNELVNNGEQLFVAGSGEDRVIWMP
jgi:hypothetical protein